MAESSRLRATAALGAGTLAVGVALLRGKVARFEVVENSMRPALRPGDYLVAVLTTAPRRGDIVVFPDPARSGRDLVKRVVGLPGEKVKIQQGQVKVGGRTLTEAWADGVTSPEGEWQIPPDTVFLLGDNRRLSSGDSRMTGPVRIDSMYRVVFRYWPALGRP